MVHSCNTVVKRLRQEDGQFQAGLNTECDLTLTKPYRAKRREQVVANSNRETTSRILGGALDLISLLADSVVDGGLCILKEDQSRA